MHNSSGSGMQRKAKFSAESMQVIAESNGLPALSYDAAYKLAELATSRVSRVVQDAAKFMHHSKRECLQSSDIESALKLPNVPPQFSFSTHEAKPLSSAIVGGCKIYHNIEKEVDFGDIVQKEPPKVPIEPKLQAHWLAIDGEQPMIPQNIPIKVPKSSPASTKVDTELKQPTLSKNYAGIPESLKNLKIRNCETGQGIEKTTSVLSPVHKMLYNVLIDACMGPNEPRRKASLEILARDSGLAEILPRLIIFITEGIKVNVSFGNLLLLIYLMRMVQALLENSTLQIEKYLHLLAPTVITCIVCKNLSVTPERDNHWALRDFSARLLASICAEHNTTTNCFQTRVTRVFDNALIDPKLPLVSLYGVISGFSALGYRVVKIFIIPRLKFLAYRIEPLFNDDESISAVDKVAAERIRNLLKKVCMPVLKDVLAPPDDMQYYSQNYGCLGPILCQAVTRARIISAQTRSTSTVKSTTTSHIEQHREVVQPTSTAVPMQQFSEVTQADKPPPLQAIRPAIPGPSPLRNRMPTPFQMPPQTVRLPLVMPPLCPIRPAPTQSRDRLNVRYQEPLPDGIPVPNPCEIRTVRASKLSAEQLKTLKNRILKPSQ